MLNCRNPQSHEPCEMKLQNVTISSNRSQLPATRPIAITMKTLAKPLGQPITTTIKLMLKTEINLFVENHDA